MYFFKKYIITKNRRTEKKKKKIVASHINKVKANSKLDKIVTPLAFFKNKCHGSSNITTMPKITPNLSQENS